MAQIAHIVQIFQYTYAVFIAQLEFSKKLEHKCVEKGEQDIGLCMSNGTDKGVVVWLTFEIICFYAYISGIIAYIFYS